MHTAKTSRSECWWRRVFAVDYWHSRNCSRKCMGKSSKLRENIAQNSPKEATNFHFHSLFAVVAVWLFVARDEIIQEWNEKFTSASNWKFLLLFFRVLTDTQLKAKNPFEREIKNSQAIRCEKSAVCVDGKINSKIAAAMRPMMNVLNFQISHKNKNKSRILKLTHLWFPSIFHSIRCEDMNLKLKLLFQALKALL